MLRVKKKGRMDSDLGEREELKAELTAPSYRRGFMTAVS